MMTERSTAHVSRGLAAAQREPALLGAWSAYAAICLLWGTTFLAVRVAIETVPTLLVPAIRFLGAGSILLIVSLVTGAPFPKEWRSWRDQAFNGVMMVTIGNTLIVWAQQSVSSGMAALLTATIPIWMAVLQTLAGARWTWRKLSGLTLGFAGVALLVAPEIGTPATSLRFFLAVGALQASAIFWNLGTLNARRRQHDGSPTANAALQMLSGGASIAIVAAIATDGRAWSISARSVAALLYLMLFGSVFAYSAYLYAQTKLPAGKVASYAYVNPVVALIVGNHVLGERLTLQMVLATGVILTGVALIQLDRRGTPSSAGCGEGHRVRGGRSGRGGYDGG